MSSASLLSFFLMRRPPPRSTLFPCTTLFRSAADEPARVRRRVPGVLRPAPGHRRRGDLADGRPLRRRVGPQRSEEHTSELQSRQYLVCRLLLEKQNHANHWNFHCSELVSSDF